MDSAIFAPPLTGLDNNKIIAMSVTRLKRKVRKDRAKSARRRTDLKNQNFKPVMKSVDTEKIKEEFKAKASKKG